MRHSWTWSRISTGLLFAVVVGGLSAPAQAETYTWRTEDGVYAYTDDPKHIPERYIGQARLVKLRSLQSYERFTAQDTVATNHYSSQLTKRLEYLRALNAAPRYAAPAQATASAPAQSAISFSTGGPNDPRLELPIGQSDAAPIVVEPILAKQTGDFRTRRVTLVKQGGKIIAVLKGNPHHYNPSTDIFDEDALEQGDF